MDSRGFTRGLALLASAATLVGAPVQAQTPPPAGQVTGDDLQALDLWASPGRDTGLDADLWEGTSARLAEAVIAPLAEQRLSPAEAALARGALATAARSPEGAEPALAGLRARTLVALGDLEAAARAMGS